MFGILFVKKEAKLTAREMPGVEENNGENIYYSGYIRSFTFCVYVYAGVVAAW